MKLGMKCTPQMRHINFPFRDRLVLIPVDLVNYAKFAVIISICFLLFSGLGENIYSIERVFTVGTMSVILILITYLLGTIIFPLLLPWLPGSVFSIKGILISDI